MSPAAKTVATSSWLQRRDAPCAIMGWMSRAKAAIIGGLAGLGVAVVLGVGAGVIAGVYATAEAGPGASSKAVRLAVAISTAMNCAAFAAIILCPAGVIVFVRRRTGR